jgi:hypothetical protein
MPLGKLLAALYLLRVAYSSYIAEIIECAIKTGLQRLLLVEYRINYPALCGLALGSRCERRATAQQKNSFLYSLFSGS